MLEYRIVPVTPFQQNCTLLWCDDSRRAAVVDPGGDPERILATIADARVVVEKILLTHGHLDHVGAAGLISAHLGVPILGPHRDDDFLLGSLEAQCDTFGLPRIASFTTGRWLEHGDRVQLGDVMLDVIHCPGHTPGHLVFFSAADRLAQVGDVIFRGSIGRTDFPRGNHAQLIDSIRSRLFVLGDDVRFIPGHGPMSSIGVERATNPFVADAAAR
jgi:glyoxylase-like metal-dependent hydrolase (beta-lactamase superfamily II)